MDEFKAAITIDASPEAVWAVLADVGAYPEWDPDGERIEGRLAVGERVRVFSRPDPSRALAARITECVGTHKLAWKGRLPLGLFHRERTIVLTAKDSQTTKVSIREAVGGPLRGSAPRSAEPIQRFLTALKKRSEGQG